MSGPEGEGSLGTAVDELTTLSSLGRVSFLEQTLWQQFNEVTAPDKFARAWLGLQCTLIPETKLGVVVLGEPDKGPFAPVAYWPMGTVGSDGLMEAAERAVAERQSLVQGPESTAHPSAARSWCIARPLLVDGRLFGVVAIELDAAKQSHLRGAIRQLQWGTGWLEATLRRELMRAEKAHLERTAAALDLVAVGVEQYRFQDACSAAVTELATRLNCEQVSIGFVRRHRIVVTALSHVAQFGQRINLVRHIANAMEEAVDQQAIVLCPFPADWEFRIDRAHRELAQVQGGRSILTIPLHASGRFFGALTLERPTDAGFDQDAIALCDCIANVIGPILEEKRQNDRLIFFKLLESARTQLVRLFGPQYFGRKLTAALAVILVAFFSFAKQTYFVNASATLEGSVQRAIIAPFDGYIGSQQVRHGDLVHAGDLMAMLDDSDLMIERLKWFTKKGEQEREYAKALAKQERADAAIIQAQIEQANAEIALLDEQIKRTRVVAPFDGLVISGDLSQSVGAAVRRGDELFQIAPLNSYRVILKVDERDIADIAKGQQGTLLVTSMPLRPLHYTVTRVTPISETDEGANVFRVEAELSELSDQLRPGMKGVSKTDIDERLLIEIWTRRLIAWLRVVAWKWLP